MNKLKARRELESLLLKAMREGRRAFKKAPVKTNWKLMKKLERNLLQRRKPQ